MEAVTPSLSTLHVSSVVDLLHRRVSAATSYNKVLDGDDMESDASLDDIKTADQGCWGCPPSGKGANNQTSSEPGSRTSRVQVMFSISKVIILCVTVSRIPSVEVY